MSVYVGTPHVLVIAEQCHETMKYIKITTQHYPKKPAIPEVDQAPCELALEYSHSTSQ